MAQSVFSGIESEWRAPIVGPMPILWRRLAWCAGFAIALMLAVWMRSRGFDWSATMSAALATYVISQLCATLIVRHAQDAARKQAKCVENLEADAPRILREYATLHEDFPGCVIDSSWLPADKQKMIDVLKLTWLQAKSDHARNWVETGWQFLSWFQDGVGQTPIRVLSKTPQNIPARQLVEYMEDQDRWLKLVFAEREVLAREIERFKAAHSKSEPIVRLR
jgi:hypothetical protein